MIYTCTLNPSLDYYMEFEDKLQFDITNRSSLEYYEAGGKGINVSIVLSNLSIPSRAFGFLGGFTKDFYITLMSKYEFIQPNFTVIDGHTRINVKLQADDHELDLNANGPYIKEEEMANMMSKVDKLDKGDYLVLAGFTPDYLEDKVAQMVKDAISHDVKVTLDTNASVIEKTASSCPFLVKTTEKALSEYFGKDFDDCEEIAEACKKWVDQGVENVLVLCDDLDIVLTSKQGVYLSRVKDDFKPVNTVGMGDSLVAGFIMNYGRSKDIVDSLRYGASCGMATSYSKGLATREKIESFYQDTEVETLEESLEK